MKTRKPKIHPSCQWH